MVTLAGGSFAMGSDGADAYPADGEGPVHEVVLSPYRIARCAVTNRQFAAFVAATAYETDAERFGWSFVFAGLLPADFEATRSIPDLPWWRQVLGARWCYPEGPHSSIDDRPDHPVIHVSWADAVAYTMWAGTRLPTEAEWEHAARGGLVQRRFPWGDELEPRGAHAMNVWQGEFPAHDRGDDGFVGTAPVDAYPPNGFGLHNTTGNVWEWTADRFDPGYYRVSPTHDPKGPAEGSRRVIRGGSYLCHESYCRRYRVAARSSNTPDASASNIGFRTAAD